MFWIELAIYLGVVIMVFMGRIKQGIEELRVSERTIERLIGLMCAPQPRAPPESSESEIRPKRKFVVGRREAGFRRKRTQSRTSEPWNLSPFLLWIGITRSSAGRSPPTNRSPHRSFSRRRRPAPWS